MSNRSWIFTSNTFDVQTEGSHPTALSLFTDTHAKLANEAADPEIAAMLAEFEPAFHAYTQIYADRQRYLGTREGKTLGFEQQMDKLNVEVRKWEAAVRTVFVEDSADEHEIFPNKRGPFQTDTYESRVSAIHALADKLTEYPQLTSLQTQVMSFYNQAESIRLIQQKAEGQIGKISDLLENQRVLATEALYGILGLLMHKFRNDRSQIVRFFDLSLLRTTGSSNDETPVEPQV